MFIRPQSKKRVAIEKLERFGTAGLITAAATQQSQRVPTKIISIAQVN
jgi:hypothetical protein